MQFTPVRIPAWPWWLAGAIAVVALWPRQPLPEQRAAAAAAPAHRAGRAEPEPAGPSMPQPGSLPVLVGTTLVDGRAAATVSDRPGSPPRQVRVGDAIGGWVVQAIEAERMTLAMPSPGQPVSVALARPVRSAPQPAPPLPPPTHYVEPEIVVEGH